MADDRIEDYGFLNPQGAMMPFPDSAFAVVTVIVLLVPGLVYGLVRTTTHGFRADDKAIDSRVAQALLVSVAFDAVYLIVVYPHLGKLIDLGKDSVEILDPVALGWAVLLGVVVAPGLLALVVYFPWTFRRSDSLLRFRLVRRVRYSSVPTAWDYSASPAVPRYVRIQLPDGRWVGGLFADTSYVSTYPEPRDIFIRHQFRMNPDGGFGDPMPESAGLWLSISDQHIVEWVTATPEEAA